MVEKLSLRKFEDFLEAFGKSIEQVFGNATFHKKNYLMASRRKVMNELFFLKNSLVAASREFNYSGRQRMFGKTITAVKSSK